MANYRLYRLNTTWKTHIFVNCQFAAALPFQGGYALLPSSTLFVPLLSRLPQGESLLLRVNPIATSGSPPQQRWSLGPIDTTRFYTTGSPSTAHSAHPVLYYNRYRQHPSCHRTSPFSLRNGNLPPTFDLLTNSPVVGHSVATYLGPIRWSQADSSSDIGSIRGTRLRARPLGSSRKREN
jgi:hypothetical protein